MCIIKNLQITCMPILTCILIDDNKLYDYYYFQMLGSKHILLVHL